MQSNKKSRLITAVCFSILYLIVNLILDSFWRFYQTHNDYWDLLFIAKNIVFSCPQSLYNPGLPIGCTSMIHFVIKLGSEVTIPIILNAIFAATTIFSALLFYQKYLSPLYSISAAFTAGFFPLYFYYSNQAGADPGSVMFFTSGSLLILDQLFIQKREKRTAVYFFAGILMGCGAIFRYHVLVGSAIFLFTALLFDIKNWRLILISVLGITAAYIPQIAVNILTSHGIFETKQGAGNVYDLMYGINWYRTSTDTISSSAFEIISTNYLPFIKLYTISFVKLFLQTGLVPLIVAVAAKRTEARRISLFILVFVVLYFAFFSATQSERRILPTVPLAMLTFGFLIEDIKNRAAGPALQSWIFKFGSITFVVLFCLYIGVKDISRINGNIKEYRLAVDIENYLMSAGCKDSKQTFTTDFTVYFRKLPGYSGYFNGGWSRCGTYKYNEAFPELTVDNLDSFLNDCKNRNIRYLILNGDAKELSPDLGKIYDSKLNRKSIVFKKQFDRIKIFQLDL